MWNFMNDGLSLQNSEKLSANIDSSTKSTHHVSCVLAMLSYELLKVQSKLQLQNKHASNTL